MIEPHQFDWNTVAPKVCFWYEPTERRNVLLDRDGNVVLLFDHWTPRWRRLAARVWFRLTGTVLAAKRDGVPNKPLTWVEGGGIVFDGSSSVHRNPLDDLVQQTGDPTYI